MPPNNSIFYIIKHYSTVHTKQCLYIIPYFRVFCKRVTHIFLKNFIAVELGAFLHWLTGTYELPQAGSTLTGGAFFAEPQREIRRRCGGSVPRPAAGAKRKDNLRFSFLFKLLPFPCLLARRRLPICDRCENRGTAEDFFFRIFLNIFAVSDTLLLHM